MTGRTLAAIAFALCLGTANAEILAQNEVELKSLPMAAGETITLGDIFDAAGEAASVTVTAAPRPGKKLAINAVSLAVLAEKNGLHWSNPNALVNVEVGRASRAISSTEIGEAVSRALADEAGNRDIAVRFLQGGIVLSAAAEEPAAPEVHILAYDEATGRFQAKVTAPGGNSLTTIGVAEEVMSVPVLARPFQRGETVKDTDLEWKPMRITSLGRQVLTDPRELIGMAARRPLRSGLPLIAGDVERPVAIVKGARVTMNYQLPGISLSDSGRALQNGAIGDTISVMNERSHRTVEARVISANAVELSPSTPVVPGPQASLAQ